MRHWVKAMEYDMNSFLTNLTSIKENNEVEEREAAMSLIELATSNVVITFDMLDLIGYDVIEEAISEIQEYDYSGKDNLNFIQSMIDTEVAKLNMINTKSLQTTNQEDFF